MNYYKRHLGDYAKKAGRLSMLQHGAFTLLIDACYDREHFPTIDDAIDWTWASSSAEIEAVEFVLRKFFLLEDGRYVQKRIQEEIAEYHNKATINARIAQEREAKRKGSLTTGARTVNEQSPNHKPLTINQEPIHTPKPPTGALFDRFWQAYPKKVGKDAAQKAFDKRKPDEGLLVEMLSTLAVQANSAQWMKDDGQFVPNPATWLNQGRWQDEVAAGEDGGMPDWMRGAI